MTERKNCTSGFGFFRNSEFEVDIRCLFPFHTFALNSQKKGAGYIYPAAEYRSPTERRLRLTNLD